MVERTRIKQYEFQEFLYEFILDVRQIIRGLKKNIMQIRIDQPCQPNSTKQFYYTHTRARI